MTLELEVTLEATGGLPLGLREVERFAPIVPLETGQPGFAQISRAPPLPAGDPWLCQRCLLTSTAL